MAERQASRIAVYGVPAVRALKNDPMPLGKGWRVLNIRGTRGRRNPAINFQSTLVSTFNVGNERFAIFQIRPWPKSAQIADDV
jgi:hypothetical protein